MSRNVDLRVNFGYECQTSILGIVDMAKHSHFFNNYVSVDKRRYPQKPEQDHQALTLSIVFNSRSIDFRICDYSLDDFDDMVLETKTLKARDIEEELNLYIGLVEAMYSRQIGVSWEKANDMRTEAHDVLSTKIDMMLKDELGLDLHTAETPSMFAREIVSSWLRHRACSEESGKITTSTIASCRVFSEELKIDRKNILGR